MKYPFIEGMNGRAPLPPRRASLLRPEGRTSRGTRLETDLTSEAKVSRETSELWVPSLPRSWGLVQQPVNAPSLWATHPQSHYTALNLNPDMLHSIHIHLYKSLMLQKLQILGQKWSNKHPHLEALNMWSTSSTCSRMPCSSSWAWSIRRSSPLKSRWFVSGLSLLSFLHLRASIRSALFNSELYLGAVRQGAMATEDTCSTCHFRWAATPFFIWIHILHLWGLCIPERLAIPLHQEAYAWELHQHIPRPSPIPLPSSLILFLLQTVEGIGDWPCPRQKNDEAQCT